MTPPDPAGVGALGRSGHDWRVDTVLGGYRCNNCLVAGDKPHGPTCPKAPLRVLAPPEEQEQRGLQWKEHELKTWPEFYSVIISGEKTFEIRRDDRGFRVGDILRLREWRRLRIVDGIAEGEYTGRETRCYVSYILSGVGLEPGIVCMGIQLQSGRAAVDHPPPASDAPERDTREKLMLLYREIGNVLTVLGRKQVTRDSDDDAQESMLNRLEQQLLSVINSLASPRASAAPASAVTALESLLEWVGGSDEYADVELAKRCAVAREVLAALSSPSPAPPPDKETP